jgi:hypothetical protein
VESRHQNIPAFRGNLAAVYRAENIDVFIGRFDIRSRINVMGISPMPVKCPFVVKLPSCRPNAFRFTVMPILLKYGFGSLLIFFASSIIPAQVPNTGNPLSMNALSGSKSCVSWSSLPITVLSLPG